MMPSLHQGTLVSSGACHRRANAKDVGYRTFCKGRELSLDLPVLFCSGSSDVLDNPVIKSDPRVDLLKNPYPLSLNRHVKKVLANESLSDEERFKQVTLSQTLGVFGP